MTRLVLSIGFTYIHGRSHFFTFYKNRIFLTITLFPEINLKFPLQKLIISKIIFLKEMQIHTLCASKTKTKIKCWKINVRLQKANYRIKDATNINAKLSKNKFNFQNLKLSGECEQMRNSNQSTDYYFSITKTLNFIKRKKEEE